MHIGAGVCWRMFHRHVGLLAVPLSDLPWWKRGLAQPHRADWLIAAKVHSNRSQSKCCKGWGREVSRRSHKHLGAKRDVTYLQDWLKFLHDKINRTKNNTLRASVCFLDLLISRSDGEIWEFSRQRRPTRSPCSTSSERLALGLDGRSLLMWGGSWSAARVCAETPLLF